MHLEFKLVRDAMSNKIKMRENTIPLLNGAGDLVTKTMKKAWIQNAFSSSVFTGKIFPQ